MTEQEAINVLLDGVNEAMADETSQDEATEATQTAETAETTANETAEAPLTQANLQEAINNAIANAQKPNEEQSQQGVQEQKQNIDLMSLTDEQREILGQLGLGNINELVEVVKTLQNERETARQEQARRETFASELAKFKEAYPQIEPDELAKWANDRGFDAMLTQGFSGWSAIAKEMIKQATTTQTPDPIIGANKSGNELGAFEKIKKGDEVSSIEVGNELLKMAGII